MTSMNAENTMECGMGVVIDVVEINKIILVEKNK
jgi:hypothetical protein